MKELEKKLFVYVGPKTGCDIKNPRKTIRAMGLVEITKKELDNERLLNSTKSDLKIRIFKRLKGVATPGTVYEFEIKPETEDSILVNSKRCVGFLSKEPLVTVWQFSAKVEGTREKAIKMEKHFQGKSSIESTLRPIKQLYKNLNRAERQALLIVIVDHLEN